MGRSTLRELWEDVLRGSKHVPGRNVPLRVNRLGQFVHGVCLPFHLARILLADREARWRYGWVCGTQAAIVLALGLVFTDTSRASVKSGALHQVVFWAALFSTMQVTQWVVIALSRDYHTAIALETSLRAGVPPEDEPLTPRVRFNGAWLRTKLKRRWRGLVVFAVGVPLLWCFRWAPGGSVFFPVLLTAWGAWWTVVFTAAKSARAWEDTAAPPPWFLRGWSWFAERIPLLRWALPNAYASVWTTFTRPVFAPAACVERQPWVFSGLAVVRALAMLPLVKCFLRPFIPVASAHLLASEGVSLPRPAAALAPPARLEAAVPPDGALPAPAALPAAGTPADQ
jgi:hypothetical protein